MKTSLARWAAAACVLASTPAQSFVLGPTTPGKWGSPVFGTGATVSYSFMPTGTSCSSEGPGCTITELGLFGPSFPVWRSEIEAAFAAWSAVADIHFTEVPDAGEAVDAPQLSGDIRIGGHALFAGLAHGFFPPANGLSAAGDLHFDTSTCWEDVFDGSGDSCFSIFQVAAHEIGHILGLDESSVPGSLMNPFYTESFSGPQFDDAAGAAFIYGPAASTPGDGGSGGGGSGVPEPMTLALLASALLAAGLARQSGRA